MTDNETPSPQTYAVYLLIILFILLSNVSFGQITVKHFNAGWNEANGVDWIMDLTDCNTKGYIDIAKDVDAQKKYKIAVVPTIIIFKDGEEVARFQADLSFKLSATREEVQEEIDNQLMSDF
jgi:thiol-disulfide isomerase/thioredoxin